MGRPSFPALLSRSGTGRNPARPARPLTVEWLEDRLTPTAGTLDPTFGTLGMVTTDFADSAENGLAMVVQPDGKIVVVGQTESGGGGLNFGLARYNPDGTPDNSFSLDGKVATDFAGGADEARGVALQPDGKIVAAGRTGSGGASSISDFALARYNADGTLDDSFGTHGQVTTDFAGGDDRANSVVIQADGKIVVVGYSRFGNNFNFALARYNADGTLDAGFGTSGKVTTEFAGGTDVANSVVIQSDGKIVAAGGTGSALALSISDFALMRYNADGTLDAGFGTSGKVTTDFGGSNDEANSVVIQADGKIVAAGKSGSGGAFPSSDFALVRYHADGTLDANFDADGRVTTDFAGPDEAKSVVIQADGKIVAAGVVGVAGGASNFGLARYNADGTLDAGFGTSGKVSTDFAGSFDGATSLVIQTDGKIVVAGRARVGGSDDFALARYLVRPATVQSVVVNDGAAQRSMVTSLTVTFSTVVTLGPGAFELLRQGGGPVSLLVNTSVVNNQTQVVLSFTGTDVVGGSLADGNYVLRVRGDLIHDSVSGQAIDADGDGVAGGDRVVGLHRLFGDTDGDRDVDNADHKVFRSTFQSQVGDTAFLWFLDFDGDGDVDPDDRHQFNTRRGTVLNP